MGDYEIAAKYCYNSVDEALKAAPEQIDYRIVVNAYNNLGVIYFRMNENRRSADYLSKAEVLCYTHGYLDQLPNILINKIDLYVRLLDYKKAQSAFEKGWKLARQYQLKEQEMSLLSSMSHMMLQQNKPHEVIRYLGTVDYHASNNSDYYFRIVPGYLLGKAYYQMGKLKEAIYNLENVLRIAEKRKIQDNLVETHEVLGSVYEAGGHYRKALVHQRTVQQLKDTLFTKDKMRSINELEISSRTAEKDRQLAHQETQILKEQALNQKKTATIWITSLGLLLLSVIIIFLRYRQVFILRNLIHQQQFALLDATIEGEEAERLRVSQELHDGVSGFLSAIKMNLITLKVKREEIATEQNFIISLQLTDEATDELKKTTQNLVPGRLVVYGIHDAIALFCERLGSQFLHIEVHEYGKPQRLISLVELSIYRSVQELVHNVVKHAKAQHATVAISWLEKVLLVSVEDNGVGIQDPAFDEQGSGLKNVRKRLTALNGIVEIVSNSGEGTSVYLEIPI